MSEHEKPKPKKPERLAKLQHVKVLFRSIKANIERTTAENDIEHEELGQTIDELRVEVRRLASFICPKEKVPIKAKAVGQKEKLVSEQEVPEETEVYVKEPVPKPIIKEIPAEKPKPKKSQKG